MESFQVAFEQLVAEVAACRRCPAMAGRRRVLSAANGPLGARVLFVAEAPGRRGAERTGIPLSGDATGRRFERLLAAAGLSRSEVFLTNAVLCNPCRAGRNRPPAASELAHCRNFLRRTLALVDPEVVVTLGRVALRALGAIAPHGASLARVGEAVPWQGRLLVPLYHPGPRTEHHRPFAQQLADYHRLGVAIQRGRWDATGQA
ncbi:MAG: uracil-DNA glycosylase [Dehalococcoidia bacterium]|nr:MAG: uracil-DNA glycosylase [Dehalococcoidia bacterium]